MSVCVPRRRRARGALRPRVPSWGNAEPALPPPPRAWAHFHVGAEEEGCWTALASACDVLGCEVDAPWPLAPGAQVLVELEDTRVGPAAFLMGVVRTCAPAPPWHAAIRFDTPGMLVALRFF